MSVEDKNEQRKEKINFKNFKGTPRKFNDGSVQTKGKVVVERRNSNFKASKSKFEKTN